MSGQGVPPDGGWSRQITEAIDEISQANRAEMRRIAEEVVCGHLGRNAATDPLRVLEIRALSEAWGQELDDALAALEARLLARFGTPARAPRRTRREIALAREIDATLERALMGFGEAESEAAG